MNREAKTAVSLAAEFRMRHWARVHYVSADLRKDTWNPIVLDEMNKKDEEMREAENNSMSARVSSMYVPLAPGVNRRIDEPHEEISSPYILKMQDPSTRYLHKLATELTAE